MEFTLHFPDSLRNQIRSGLILFSKSLNAFVTAVLDKIADMLVQYHRVSGRIRHLAKYAKKRRIWKKNRGRILREIRKWSGT